MARDNKTRVCFQVLRSRLSPLNRNNERRSARARALKPLNDSRARTARLRPKKRIICAPARTGAAAVWNARAYANANYEARRRLPLDYNRRLALTTGDASGQQSREVSGKKPRITKQRTRGARAIAGRRPHFVYRKNETIK